MQHTFGCTGHSTACYFILLINAIDEYCPMDYSFTIYYYYIITTVAWVIHSMNWVAVYASATVLYISTHYMKYATAAAVYHCMTQNAPKNLTDCKY